MSNDDEGNQIMSSHNSLSDEEEISMLNTGKRDMNANKEEKILVALQTDPQIAWIRPNLYKSLDKGGYWQFECLRPFSISTPYTSCLKQYYKISHLKRF